MNFMQSCADSVVECTDCNQRSRGGLIPASALHFATGQTDDAIHLVKKFHYSRRAPTNIQFVGTLHLSGGLFGDTGECVAACFFSIPPTRWSENVLELSRLVRSESAKVPLTMLVSMCCKWLKRKGHNLLVSFADQQQGHHGGIYQAAGWFYDCKRSKSMDGLLINGKFYPGRTCNSIYGTRSPEKLKEIHPELEITPHFDEGKHIYWKPLTKEGVAMSEKLGLRKSQYPKPNQQNT